MQHIRIAVVGLLLAGAAGVAGAQQTQPAPQAPRAHGRHEMTAGRHGPGRGMARGLFRGIQLTDAEKASLKAVHEKYQAQFETLRDAAKPQREAMRAARQKGDTAALKALRAQAEPQRAKMQALMTQMRGELRAALTPEHQAQFDKNVAQMQERAAKRGENAARRHGKGQKGLRGRA